MVPFHRLLRSVFPICFALALACPIHAASVAYSFQTALVASDFPLSLGFEFSTTEAVTIYAFGYYDEGGDGFLTPHEVGIFDSGGTLLASTLLSSGSGAPLIGDFRYQDITPLLLPAGESFTIAATSGGPADEWVYGTAGTSITGFVTDPAIQIAQDAGVFLYQDDNILRDPTNHYLYTLYGGPNFLLDPADASVPEPGTGALFSLVVLALFAAARFRRRHPRAFSL
jgi:hypothetical protein